MACSAGARLLRPVPGACQIHGLNNISFVNNTCEVDTGSRSISVPLGSIRADTFKGIDSTSPDKTFNVGLTCSQPAGAYNVAVTFNATTDASRAARAADAICTSGRQ